jgi:predicted AAA+ superfamily ATPase
MTPNMTHHRYLEDQVRRDLQRKMAFVAGPRQVGKTTLALDLPDADAGYLNWDIPEHRERILKGELPPAPLWVFDEIHKYRSWRDYLKGVFDGRREGQQILVTGSARLEYYRFSGDSLQGRYHMLRLHPLSVAELGITHPEGMNQLMQLGGFPEPFFGGSEVDARRWSREYRNLLINEDVTSLERVQDLGNLELLMLRLPDLVGSPLSVNAIREDLRLSHKTVSTWLAILERLYAVFRVSPFGSPRIRAVTKAQKHYHLDWTLVSDPAHRFEDLVACHLLKWVHFRQDTEGLDLELRYFRDRDGREVDFVIAERGEPRMLVECKWTDGKVDRSLRYLKTRFPGCDAWQISATGTKDFVSRDGIRVCPAVLFLGTLV